jgi:hypothetical protein
MIVNNLFAVQHSFLGGFTEAFDLPAGNDN